MTIEKRFTPIASRDLIFVNADKFETPIHVAIGAPYAPALADEAKHYAGCMVLTCEDPELATEVFGIDEFEALEVALSFLRLFLSKLAATEGGELLNKDRSKFDPEGSPLLKQISLFSNPHKSDSES